MINDIDTNAQQKMDNAIASLHNQLQKLRTGRATPSLLDHITIDYYGSQTPLNQVANITVEGAQALLLTPWEKANVQPIEKAIFASDLGLAPATSGDSIRLTLPALTEERRRELIKIAKDDAEKTRISIRNIRRDANQEIKQALKQKEISEDQSREDEGSIQDITNHFTQKIDVILADKEKELISI